MNNPQKQSLGSQHREQMQLQINQILEQLQVVQEMSSLKNPEVFNRQVLISLQSINESIKSGLSSIALQIHDSNKIAIADEDDEEEVESKEEDHEDEDEDETDEDDEEEQVKEVSAPIKSVLNKRSLI